MICLLLIAVIFLSFGGTAYAAVTDATPSQTLLATGLTVIVSCLFIIFSVMLAMRSPADSDGGRGWPVFLMAAALAVAFRLFIAAAYPGYSIDIGCFKAWAHGVYEYGPAGFYENMSFADYPPGYMYILWILGFLRSVFSIDYSSALFTAMIKLPAIISEVVLAAFVYRIAARESGKMFAVLCSSLLLFNPALFLNSSIWGQIDAVFTLFMVFSLYYLTKERYLAGAFFFAVGLLVKPQAIMFLPVVGLAYFYALFKKGGLKKAVIGIFGGIAIGAAVIFLGALPFTGNQPALWIVNRYTSTMGSYPYGTLNAFNLFALFGGNWKPYEETLLILDFKTWGTIFLVLICVAVVFVQWRSRERRPYFDISAFLIISLFMLMHMVHERYIVPACVLLVFAYAYSRDLSTLIFTVLWSASALLNQIVVLYAQTSSAPETPLMALSAVNIVLYIVYAVITARKLSSGKVLIKSPAMLG
jgi:Gpi18-like mannosyltransferase